MQSSAGSDPGRRANNEDVIWAEDRLGLYVVIDGMGGHRAGEHAAQIACETLRRRLTTRTPDARRLRESIAEANNQIYAAAQKDPAKAGMGCVLTAAWLSDGRLLIGHVGDTRLYRIQGGRIEKLTRDHSPVGDLEAGGFLTEEEARRHPRRHQIYRDVGTMYRLADTPNFIDVYEETFPSDAALVLCSDGLTDAIASDELYHIVTRSAGHPDQTVKDLIALANERGGRDNISLIVIEGDRFPGAAGDEITQRSLRPPAGPAPEEEKPRRRSRRRRLAVWLLAALAIGLLVLGRVRVRQGLPLWPFWQHSARELVVQPGSYRSITEALRQARPGDTVIVTPGRYHEALRLPSGVSLIARGAVQLAPGQFPAVTADKVSKVTVRGFEIDSPEGPKFEGATILIVDADVLITHTLVGGNARVGVEIRGSAKPTLRENTIAGHETGVLIYGEAAPQLLSNQIVKNSIGVSAAERSRPALARNQILDNYKREVIIDNASVPSVFEENIIGLTGVDIRDPALERKLAPETNNVYLENIQVPKTVKSRSRESKNPRIQE